MDSHELKQAARNSPAYGSKAEMWHTYLHDACPEDVFLEFGVRAGASINYMANVRPRNVFYGFDSFQGLPSAWGSRAPAGAFKVENRKALKFLPNVRLEEGLFEDTLPGFVERANASEMRITRIHVDCDIYSSTACVLSHLEEVIGWNKPLIQFDEFHNYDGFEEHEFRAFLEFINRTGMDFGVVGHIPGQRQCLIVIK